MACVVLAGQDRSRGPLSAWERRPRRFASADQSIQYTTQDRCEHDHRPYSVLPLAAASARDPNVNRAQIPRDGCDRPGRSRAAGPLRVCAVPVNCEFPDSRATQTGPDQVISVLFAAAQTRAECRQSPDSLRMEKSGIGGQGPQALRSLPFAFGLWQSSARLWTGLAAGGRRVHRLPTRSPHAVNDCCLTGDANGSPCNVPRAADRSHKSNSSGGKTI
jgi:hypothetical protein